MEYIDIDFDGDNSFFCVCEKLEYGRSNDTSTAVYSIRWSM